MPQKPPTASRLEAFSDGVIAVIITIMVLELKVPRQDGMAGLYALLPTLLIYLLSFAFTGIYWMNHHHLVGRIESVDGVTLYANLSFLFFLSLLPFFTAYVLEKKEIAFAVALYAVSMCVTGTSFLWLRLAVHRNLKRGGDFKSQDTAAQRKHFASLGIYLLAAPMAYFHTNLALILIAANTLIWIVPDLGVGRGEDR